MANQIQATVYQIDGNPLTTSISVSFLTSDIMMYEATLSNIPDVQSAIVYYPSTSNQLQTQTFFVSEDLNTLFNNANSGIASQISSPILEINDNPLVSPINYSFPANGVSIWSKTIGISTVTYVSFKNKTYTTEYDEATLIAQANAGGGGSTPGIDSVLAINQLFSADRQIDCNGYDWSLEVKDARSFTATSYNISLQNTNENTFVNVGPSVELGGITNNTSFIVNDSTYNVKTTFAGENFGLNISNGATRVSQLGDLTSGTYNGTAFSIDDGNQNIVCYNDGIANGLSLDYSQSRIKLFYADNLSGRELDVQIFGTTQIQMGDIFSTANGTQIIINDAAQKIEFNGSLITVGGSHTPASDYLKITVNGVDYVIQLLNP